MSILPVFLNFPSNLPPAMAFGLMALVWCWSYQLYILTLRALSLFNMRNRCERKEPVVLMEPSAGSDCSDLWEIVGGDGDDDYDASGTTVRRFVS